MKAVIQRVKQASVTINASEKRSIRQGLLVLLGVENEDTAQTLPKLASKVAGLRIFDDANGNLNISAQELGLEIMVISNFTLCSDTRKGNRPSFTSAARPGQAEPLYDEFVRLLYENGIQRVVKGEFGADMQLEIINDGPVTIIIDTKEWQA